MPQPHSGGAHSTGGEVTHCQWRMVVQMVSSWKTRNLAGCQAQLPKKHQPGLNSSLCPDFNWFYHRSSQAQLSSREVSKAFQEPLPTTTRIVGPVQLIYHRPLPQSSLIHFLLTQPRNVTPSLWSQEACPFQGGKSPHTLGLIPGLGVSLVFLIMDILQLWPDSSPCALGCSLTSPQLSSPHSRWPLAQLPGCESIQCMVFSFILW